MRADFYSAYQKESAEYDTRLVKQYDEDLDTTLIFVSPPQPTLVATLDLEQAESFSAVCSAFVISLQGKLKLNPVNTSTAYFEAILNTPQNHGSTGSDTVSPTWTGPSPTDVTVSILLYAGLSTSLLVAFLAMLGKRWLNRSASDREARLPRDANTDDGN